MVTPAGKRLTMSAWAVAQAAEASLVASESMERPTAVKLTMLFSTFFQASSASATATSHRFSMDA